MKNPIDPKAVLAECERLHKYGFAIHWLRHQSKVPLESGWTTGPRKSFDYLRKTFNPGMNIGVRLGTPSKIGDYYLAVIDVDVKGDKLSHTSAAYESVSRLLHGCIPPSVVSGRGGGSLHYYCLTRKPFKTVTPFQSEEKVKVLMPSKKVSQEEKRILTEKEIHDGFRMSRAWEVSLYSEGRQVVLPPSVHPDTGKRYYWSKLFTGIETLPILDFESFLARNTSPSNPGVSDAAPGLEDFKPEIIELDWLPVSNEMRDAIKTGVGVSDRSAYLLKASKALFSAGLNQNEVLSVLTDKTTFLGECAYDHAKTENRIRAAEWVYRYTSKEVERAKDPTNAFSKEPIVSRELSKEEQEKEQKQFDEERNWKESLILNKNKMPSALVQNVILILSNAVSPKLIKRDEFAYRDTYDCDTPWGGKAGHVISDDDIPKIKNWLGTYHKFEPSSGIISDALIVLACRNAFDPVKNLLDELPEWDGVSRLDTWLKDNFEAKGDAEYLAQVFRKWMIAMVMRVYEPGCKFDWMPIFEGAQGIGKSSFGRLLVGDKYFLDWLPNLHDKDSALSLQGMWGVEMGELSQFRRNELETIKAFITRTVDKLRPPYGKRLIESPRRCVFFGTTNRENYLIDETGNRRFKPIEVGALNFKNLKRDRTQLFAEAKHLYLAKTEENLFLELTENAKEFEREIHAKKMVLDDSQVMEDCMREFIEKVEKKEVTFDLQNFKILDLFSGVGPLGSWKKENKNFQLAAKMLKRMKGSFKKIHGFKVWSLRVSGFYLKPDTMKRGEESYI